MKKMAKILSQRSIVLSNAKVLHGGEDMASQSSSAMRGATKVAMAIKDFHRP